MKNEFSTALWDPHHFNPRDLSKSDMEELANSIESYIELLEEVMIFPEELEGNKKEFEEAIKTSKKLVKKLREGNKNVFKNALEDEE